jgi:ABC-type multidrug transport system fused ATPase/permease subunit
MGFLKNLFIRRAKNQDPMEDEWDEIVYARDDVNFADSEQRKQYITNCLEQMAEAASEIRLLTGEYSLVTSYLTDMEEIEALPEEEREEIDRTAGKLTALEREITGYREKRDRMSDADYHRIKSMENEVEEGIKKLKENEEYGQLVKKDMRKLDAERHAYAYRKEELTTMLSNFRGMAVIFLTALVVCVLLLAVLQFGLDMNVFIGYFLSVGAAAIAITVLCVKFTDADRELTRVENAINKLIQLQNKVKIRYVNNVQLLEYLHMKYDTDSAAKLENLWQLYQAEKEERKQYAEAEAKIEYYRHQLVSNLSKYRVKNPDRWVHQTAALLDKREMVEIRHELILRRQSLRKQMDYNNGVADTARKEIMDISGKYPQYSSEILRMVEVYEAQENN